MRHVLRRLLVVWAAVAAGVAMTASLSQGAQTDEGVERGREVFAANCAMCHGGSAEGMMGMHPSLRGAVDRLSLEGVEVAIRNGRDTNPPMPAFGDQLSDGQINQVIAYIESLPPGPRNFGPDAGGMMDGGMMDGNVVVPAVFLAAVVTVVLVTLAVLLARRRRTEPRSPAREELDRRYAAGELSREEYLQRRRDLES